MPPPGECNIGSTRPSRGTASDRQRCTRERLKANFPDEDPTCVSEAATAAVAASASEEESGPKWQTEEEFDPQVALEVANSRNVLSGAGSDGLRFSHLRLIIGTDFGRGKCGSGIASRGKLSMI